MYESIINKSDIACAIVASTGELPEKTCDGCNLKAQDEAARQRREAAKKQPTLEQRLLQIIEECVDAALDARAN